jgi:hypothetical protein
MNGSIAAAAADSHNYHIKRFFLLPKCSSNLGPIVLMCEREREKTPFWTGEKAIQRRCVTAKRRISDSKSTAKRRFAASDFKNLSEVSQNEQKMGI